MIDNNILHLQFNSNNEFNYDKENKIVKGIAFTYDKYTLLENYNGKIIEIEENIEKDALTEDIIKQSDVYALIDHNKEKSVLARSKFGVGSLTLTLTEKGLEYEFTLGNSFIHKELEDYLERGEITQSSFSGYVNANDYVIEKIGENKYKRVIKKIQFLTDVSPVFTPANPNTSSNFAKSIEEIEAKEIAKKLENEKKENEEKLNNNLNEKKLNEYNKLMKLKYLK